ncbi:hypothetical protein PPERSA_07863 [Pseudocohnilembus persalinus]|uniref:Uncharacterized protein n=1 Tax=Pseudocohnilembus persalinus TaxID=266149 RepID=A0A0V0QCA1_PSEPJ|nr:hypothetical protein PPERSA_07863 [Pseudocohnilembus persalinus]|eukprot:KRW99786.1 hypothetical protein PPERSA_07863 [Pseudocohnilembus persalinus]
MATLQNQSKDQVIQNLNDKNNECQITQDKLKIKENLQKLDKQEIINKYLEKYQLVQELQKDQENEIKNINIKFQLQEQKYKDKVLQLEEDFKETIINQEKQILDLKQELKSYTEDFLELEHKSQEGKQNIIEKLQNQIQKQKQDFQKELSELQNQIQQKDQLIKEIEEKNISLEDQETELILSLKKHRRTITDQNSQKSKLNEKLNKILNQKDTDIKKLKEQNQLEQERVKLLEEKLQQSFENSKELALTTKVE